MKLVLPFYLLVTTSYLVDTSRYLVVTSGYLIVITGYFWLLLVTSGYFWLLMVPRFSNKAPVAAFSLPSDCSQIDVNQHSGIINTIINFVFNSDIF